MQHFDWLSDRTPLLAAKNSWHNGDYLKESVFHLNFQSEAPFAIVCGAGLLAEHVRRFRFTPDIIARMGRMTDAQGKSIFDESFLNHLQRMKLRVEVDIPHEGMLLLPGEPLLIARGPTDQIQLLVSAFKVLVWESTYWATFSAYNRWKKKDWKEEETPRSPAYQATLEGWKIRAMFIGGALTDEILENIKTPIPAMKSIEMQHWIDSSQSPQTAPLVQIRRLFKTTEAVGDVWLTEQQDQAASVSRSTILLADEVSKTTKKIKFTRFQNLYYPALAKGHPLLVSTRKGYFRQRTLHQMAAFHEAQLYEYPRGWYVDNMD